MKRRRVDLGPEVSEGRLGYGEVGIRTKAERTDCEAGPSTPGELEAEKAMRLLHGTAEECEVCRRRRGARGDEPLSLTGSTEKQPSIPSRRHPPRKPRRCATDPHVNHPAPILALIRLRCPPTDPRGRQT